MGQGAELSAACTCGLHNDRETACTCDGRYASAAQGPVPFVGGIPQGLGEPETPSAATPSRYRTIVADPPWNHSEGTGLNLHNGSRVETRLPYGTMTVEQIAALPVRDLAEADRWHVNGNRGGCTLFLWTTTRYLYEAHDIARGWGFKPNTVLVWCKPYLELFVRRQRLGWDTWGEEALNHVEMSA